MSMILDALTRAEHERQLEKQPDLKFVTPVKPQKKNPNKIWLWLGLAITANALVLFFLVRIFSGGDENTAAVVQIQQPNVDNSTMSENIQAKIEQPSQVAITQEHGVETLAQGTMQIEGRIEVQEISNDLVVEARPLAMEANSAQLPEVDRPLIYESKQPSAKPKVANVTPQANVPKTTKGNVSFSSTELSADDAIPVSNKPKLLIDGVSGNDNASNVQNVRDLPENSRAKLNQYEVNVHVFDDDPLRRFVLINMDKYKEGDRIVNNGPLVEEITPLGVVVEYGNGRALLPAK